MTLGSPSLPHTRAVRCTHHRLAAGALAFLAIVIASGCGRPDPSQRPKLPREIRSFDALYGKHCAGCHGESGRLGPAPPLNDPLFLHIISDSDLARIVEGGRAGTLMTAFAESRGGPLTKKQIDVLVKEMRARWAGSSNDLPSSPPPYTAGNEGDTTPSGDARAGGKLFAEVCARCHGKSGDGTKKAGPLADAAFLALMSDTLLRRLVITGRPDLGMPDYRELGEKSDLRRPLQSDEIDDLVAFLAHWRVPGATASGDARK